MLKERITHNLTRKSLFVFIGIILLISSLNADGFIIPLPPNPGDPYPPLLTVKYHHVDVEINDQVAITKIDQSFYNETNRDVEGEYIFPLPKGASISKFTMYLGNEAIKGKVLDKDEARKIYEEIVRKRKDPALLEYIGRDLFKARVYPIPARGEKRITIDYSQILKLDNGLCEYIYPLNTERFSKDPIKSVKVNITLKSQSRIKTVYSPSHDVIVNKIDAHKVEIEYFEDNTRPDKDLVLYYTVSKEDLGLNMIPYRKDEEDGFFLAMITPDAELESEKIVAKDIIFVLDRSGSMSGEKIEQAKSALERCLNSLNIEDKFEIIFFNDDIEQYKKEIVKASSNTIKEAIMFIHGIDADGGTNINDALITAMKLIKPDNRPKYLIFLTDGLPTVGIQNISDIVENVNTENANNARLFVFGVGYDVNTRLLDRLSAENKGATEYVKPEEDLEVKISNFYGKIAYPIMTNLKLECKEVKLMQIYPKILPDLFKGSQLLLLGRYEGNGKAKLTLSGNVIDKKKTFTYNTEFPKQDERNSFIPRLWASRRIGYLIEKIRSHGEEKELVDEITKLSKKYGIITEYTSFLVETDAEFTLDEARDMAYEEFEMLESTTTGSKSVSLSKSAQNMQRSLQAPTSFYSIEGKEVEVQNLKQIKDKTFYFKKDRWVDAKYDEELPKIEIKRYSDAYFQLIVKKSIIGSYLSVGDNIVIVIGKYQIVISNKGKEKLSEKELKNIFG